MKKYYKISYQDNMKGYFLDEEFSTENDAWHYIEDNNLNNGYSFYNVEELETKQKGQ